MCDLKAGLVPWRSMVNSYSQHYSCPSGNALVLAEVRFLEGTLCIMYSSLLTLITFLEVPLGSSKLETVSQFSVMLFNSSVCELISMVIRRFRGI